MPDMLLTNCESSLVKSRTEVVGAIEDDVGKIVGESFDEFVLLSGLR
jgi:hypothetical protein